MRGSDLGCQMWMQKDDTSPYQRYQRLIRNRFTFSTKQSFVADSLLYIISFSTYSHDSFYLACIREGSDLTIPWFYICLLTLRNSIYLRDLYTWLHIYTRGRQRLGTVKQAWDILFNIYKCHLLVHHINVTSLLPKRVTRVACCRLYQSFSGGITDNPANTLNPRPLYFIEGISAMFSHEFCHIWDI